MSFIEGISAGAVDTPDALLLCIGSIAVLVTLLLAPPVVATALRVLRVHELIAFYSKLIERLHRHREH